MSPAGARRSESKRIRKHCRRKAGPGNDVYDATPGQKRPASQYNKFVREHMLTYDFPGGTTQKEKMYHYTTTGGNVSSAVGHTVAGTERSC